MSRERLTHADARRVGGSWVPTWDKPGWGSGGEGVSAAVFLEAPTGVAGLDEATLTQAAYGFTRTPQNDSISTVPRVHLGNVG